MSRYALITGAAGDLGRAACVALAADGWSLFITDHPAQAERLEITREACAASGVEIESAVFDVTDHDAVAHSAGALGERHGVPTAIVANAGIQGDFVPVQDAEVDDFRRVIDVNVVGVFTVVKATARLMIDAGTGGSIIAAASMAGVNGAPNMPAYSASKAAVIGLAKTASKDLAPHGIRVNAVCPGTIDTPILGPLHDSPELLARLLGPTSPSGRIGAASEVAEVIAFLVSDAASFMTGATVAIDGGMTSTMGPFGSPDQGIAALIGLE
jgi:NAD(P)-dependent dehydrogenase (short-subunit alcohol dehydrogenase family)